MNIAPRAFLGFALIGALMLILGVFALHQMSKIRAAAEDITLSSVPSIRALDEFTQLTCACGCCRTACWSTASRTCSNKPWKPSTAQPADPHRPGVYEKLIEGNEERAAYDNMCACSASTARSKTG
jgi:methyl-accepting chemotaxis protein